MDPLKLENQLCFPLYAAAREVVKKYTPFLSEIDLTYTQYIVMMVLWEAKQIGIKELGEKLRLDSGTLTPLLKKMQQRGLITKERSAIDERNVTVLITADGEALRAKAITIPEQIAHCISLTPEECAVLYKLLYQILDK
ncbi:MAG: MarR family transcriptional regulator [Lachnospiraceae bacterium]|jgi:DNA-binding MarR family transcriptional regulator|nr:MarR family transcriptional regulator [Lachnospiraceae bacterium]